MQDNKVYIKKKKKWKITVAFGIREYILKRDDCVRAMRKYFCENGVLLKIVGKNVIYARRRKGRITNIIRGKMSIEFFKLLIPQINGKVKSFKLLGNGIFISKCGRIC